MSTLSSYLHGGSGGRPTSPGYYSPIRRFAGRVAEAWRHHREEIELESLPFDVRKDIGFPSIDEEAELHVSNGKTR